MKIKVSILAFILILLPLLTSRTFAQVQTRIRTIEASNVGSSVDPSLRDVHDDLGSLFNFTSYRLLRDESVSLTLNKPYEISAHREVSLEVTLVSQKKNTAQYRIRIRRGPSELLNTQVRLSSGRTVLVGGPKHGQGIVILALSARF
jgi:hypothetical protein